MTIYFALWACSALFLTVSATKLALKRGQNPYFWALVTLLFGFFALAILYLIPLKEPSREAKPALIMATEMTNPFPANEPNPSFYPSSSKDYRLWYYLDSQGKAIGPMSKKVLIDCLQSGQITKQSYVWSDHMSDWKKMLDIVDLSTDS